MTMQVDQSHLDALNAWLAGGAVGPPPSPSQVSHGPIGVFPGMPPGWHPPMALPGGPSTPPPGPGLRRVDLGGGWVAIQRWDPDRNAWVTIHAQHVQPAAGNDLDALQKKHDLDADLLNKKEAYDKAQSEAERQSREALAQAKLAEDARQFDVAQQLREKAQKWLEEKDRLDRDWQKTLFEYKTNSDALDRDYRKDIALGRIGGEPTLDAQRLALERDRFGLTQKQYEDELANAPQNFYNYTFRSRGYEPPPLPGRPPGAPAGLTATPGVIPPGFTQPSERNIGDWRNFDVPGLKARFSATELARLPLEALADFSNEDLMTIGQQHPGGLDAFLRLFPRERILGTGPWAGRNTGFGQDVQDRLYGPSGTNGGGPTVMSPPASPVMGGPTRVLRPDEEAALMSESS